MSADHYTTCPRCKANAEKRQQELIEARVAAYGKVPQQEYEDMAIDIAAAAAVDKMGLAEDCEYGIDANGNLSLHYSAFCRKCQFSFEYKYDAAKVHEVIA